MVGKGHGLRKTDAAKHKGESRQQANDGPFVSGERAYLLFMGMFVAGRIAGRFLGCGHRLGLSCSELLPL
jgi:hypothetical protein